MVDSTKTGGFKLNDLVWAKMKSYCAWPGRIVEPTQELMKLKKNASSQCIFFFGSYNYAWIEDFNLKPYLEFKDQMTPLGKPKVQFDKAVEEAESYIADPDSYIAADANSSARKKLSTKIRKSEMDFDNLLESEDSISRSTVDSTTPNRMKKIINKQSAQKRAPEKKSKSAGNTPTVSKQRVSSTEMDIETPAKRSRLSETSSPIPAATTGTGRKYPAGKMDIVENDYTETPNTLGNNDYSSPASRRRAAKCVIDRQTVGKPQIEDVDLNSISETLKSKHINASTLKFGFLGLGIMGSGIVKNLLNSRHDVIVWNRTKSKCEKFVAAGAEEAITPSEVMEKADITFSCVSDPAAVKETIFGNCGILSAKNLSGEKGFVEMTSIDAETSRDIAAALLDKDVRYLEAQIQGKKTQAEMGELIILAAGNRSLFQDCQTCFEAMGKNSFFLGEVGNAAKMNLVFQTMTGIFIGGLAEAMALAEKSGLQKKDILEVLELTTMKSDLLMDKGRQILTDQMQVNLPLMHLQKDLKLSLNMSDSLNHPMPLAATANEIFKHARRLGYSEHDASAIFVRARY